MVNSPTPQPEGLRVRKKRATENAIETSAVDLALELGIANVTVEMICERADISRSTFFNYFAGRDYAIVGRGIQSLEGEAAEAVLSASPGDLARGIVQLIFASIGHQHINTDVARKRSQLTAEQPEAQRLTAVSMLESSVSLMPVVINWLVTHPDQQKMTQPEHEATLAIGLAHVVFSALLIDMREADGDVLPTTDAIDRAISDIRLLLG